jgi:protein tyrosine phosphatase (PTP) superfamily phosphohydrolase (DUF442 family)
MNIRKMPGLAVRFVLVGLFLSVPAYLGLQNFAWFEPFLYPLHMMQGKQWPVGPELLLGPYPDHSELSRLRRHGYRAVVSLLSPDLVYERSLLEREQRNAKALGITLYNFPMNSSESLASPLNASAIRDIEQLLAGAKGQQFYIHCYLGKHRTVMVSEWLEQHGGDALVANAAP